MPPPVRQIASHDLWPVGQGGFATGQVTGGGRPLTYAYDCGANKTTLLRARIRDYAASTEQLDLLFISHLDADHVNGIDDLSLQVTIKTVVLPYFDEPTAFWIAAAAESGGGGSWSLAELLGDPGGWAGRRGIQRIILVDRFNGEPGPPPDNIPLPPEPIKEPGRFWRIVGGHQSLNVVPPAGPSIELLSPQAYLQVELDVRLAWILLPFVPPIDSATMQAFEQELARQLPAAHLPSIPGPVGAGSPALMSVLRDPALRKRLKSAYRVIDSDHNAVSLALFSGPLGGPDLQLRGNGGWREPLPGRLFTGDAPVPKRHYGGPFFAYYDSWFAHCGLAQLPHHGAGTSVNDEFFARLGAITYICCAGERKRYGHPSSQVVAAARRAGQYRHVGESTGSHWHDTTWMERR